MKEGISLTTGYDQTIASESTLERARRIRDLVEQMIAAVGEHPELELKREWRRDTLYLKAEFIKDIQSIANSAIPEGREKYLVVGADEKTKEITGCDHSDFDDAGIRQLLEAHLDPVPEFEILRLQASNGHDFVVLRFPHQPSRPFVVRASIRDNSRSYLEEGQIWLKPGGPDTASSGKRLLKSRSEVLDLIDIEPRVQRAVTERMERLIPAIRLEERTRLQGQTVNAVSALTSSDEEFESYVEHLLANPNANHLNILIEKLREKTVDVWDVDLEDYPRLTPQDILRIKEEFIPAMRRATLLGLLLIKFSAPLEWFSKIADLLLQVFNASHELPRAIVHNNRHVYATSLDEHASHTVPALESLLSAYLLAGYELSRRNSNTYMDSFLNRVVRFVGDPSESGGQEFYMFWPVTSGWSAPGSRRDQIAMERYGKGDRIERLLGGKNGIKAAVLQIDCLVDWHSFLSLPNWGEPETAQYYQQSFAEVSTIFHPNFIFEHFKRILPLINQLWAAIHTTGDKNYWLVSPGLAQAFGRIDPARRELAFGRFLVYAEQHQSRWMFQNNRFPYDMPWPSEITDLVRRVRNSSQVGFNSALSLQDKT